MKDKVFIDTNIYIYFLLDDEKHSEKRKEARKIIKYLADKEIITSIQVLNEIYSVLLKYKVSEEIIKQKLEFIISKTKLVNTNIETLKNCWEIKSKHKYSYWDSLIISSALQAKCLELLTEDLHNNQIIENKLKIINPFKL